MINPAVNICWQNITINLYWRTMQWPYFHEHYIKISPVIYPRWFKPISTWVKLYPAAAWLLDNLVMLSIIVVSTSYLLFYPINDSRCILYLLCIDLLKIIEVPLVQLSLLETNNLSNISFSLRFIKRIPDMSKQEREMLLKIWLWLCEMSSYLKDF